MQSKIDYIFGIRATVEAINAGKEIEKVLISKGFDPIWKDWEGVMYDTIHI